ncbi:hypothetical protein [Bacillus sp. FJAT-29814]|uniref:hypothetical protein n=1 Tax=Bacillus sp. FJAT-29814 TaxID=1729688 RepID=UPI00082AAB76|nr:hypothetical protein [Bacillus sp. FJAT-29814]
MKLDFLELAILDDFKQAINDHSDFLIKRYSNFDGKNKINVIFSAKDWLHIVVNGMPNVNIHHDNDDIQSINVMQFISLIDLLSEAIQQIYRVLYNKKNYFLVKDKSIFQKGISDDQYFSHLRASFAAHPVNLTSFDGSESESKYYASWSSKHGKGDFSVYLYSNKPGEPNRELSISFDLLIKYAKKRYLLLEEYVKEIKRQEKDHNNNWSKISIKNENDPLTHLLILKEENQKRFGNYGYKEVIEELIELFEAPMKFPSDNELYINFLNKLKPAIQEIHQNLQNMNNIDLSIYPYPRTYTVKKLRDFRYDFEKFGEHFTNPYKQNKDNLVSYHLNRLIKEGILPEYASLDMDKRDLRLLYYSWLEKHGASIVTPVYDYDFTNRKVEITFIDDLDE